MLTIIFTFVNNRGQRIIGSLKIIVEVSRNGARHTAHGGQPVTHAPKSWRKPRGQGVLLLIFKELKLLW